MGYTFSNESPHCLSINSIQVSVRLENEEQQERVGNTVHSVGTH